MNGETDFGELKSIPALADRAGIPGRRGVWRSVRTSRQRAEANPDRDAYLRRARQGLDRAGTPRRRDRVYPGHRQRGAHVRAVRAAAPAVDRAGRLREIPRRAGTLLRARSIRSSPAIAGSLKHEARCSCSRRTTASHGATTARSGSRATRSPPRPSGITNKACTSCGGLASPRAGATRRLPAESARSAPRCWHSQVCRRSRATRRARFPGRPR